MYILAAQSEHFVVITVRILQYFQNKWRINMSYSNAMAEHGPNVAHGPQNLVYFIIVIKPASLQYQIPTPDVHCGTLST